jgi:hypothetical protein
MKTEQLQESIGRFRASFWDRIETDRPPVGIVDPNVWLPIQYLRHAPDQTEIKPESVIPALVKNDYEHVFANRTFMGDDLIPFAAPWRGIPWLEAMCGCSVQYASGSLAPKAWIPTCAQLQDMPIPAHTQWLTCMRRQLDDLRADLPEDCWVSPTILRGPSDVIAALRGLEDFYCDLYDDPDTVTRTAARVNQLLLEVLDTHFQVVSPKLNGYGHIFGYWAPEETVVIQEDAMGMCAPSVYRDIFRPFNQQIVDHLGSCVLFHLHSTGYAHFRDILGIQGLAGLELTVEQNGPSLMDMLPDLQEILERSRLILYVEAYVDELVEVVRQLPQVGLYLQVPTTHVRTETEFQDLLQSLFDHRLSQ